MQYFIKGMQINFLYACKTENQFQNENISVIFKCFTLCKHLQKLKKAICNVNAFFMSIK